jgi:hypothetical protein
MKKYYIEVYSKIEQDYILQSDWFDTEKEAIEWAIKIFYKTENLLIDLMASDGHMEGDKWIESDIYLVKTLK